MTRSVIAPTNSAALMIGAAAGCAAGLDGQPAGTVVQLDRVAGAVGAEENRAQFADDAAVEQLPQVVALQVAAAVQLARDAGVQWADREHPQVRPLLQPAAAALHAGFVPHGVAGKWSVEEGRHREVVYARTEGGAEPADCAGRVLGSPRRTCWPPRSSR